MLLLNGDCIDFLGCVPTDSIDLVILDLPYSQTDCKWDTGIDLASLWIELIRVGKPNTAYVFFCTTKFGYQLIKSNEKMFRYDLVWDKTNSSAGFLNARKQPLRGHEMLYVFYDKQPIYNIEQNHIRIGKQTNDMIQGTVYNTKIKRVTGQQWEPKLPRSILSYGITNKYKGRLHSTEKPVELLKWIIKYYSHEGGLVLDPTMGSGSVGVACKELNREFIGIEKDHDIFMVAAKRLEYFAEDESL